MKLKTTFVAAILASALGCSAFANDVHDARVDLMKKNGAATGTLAAMAKGQAPFDQAAVKAALETIAEVGRTFPDHYGPGTESADSESSPKIWENMDDFKAMSMKLATDAETQLAQLPTDAAGLGPVLGAIGANCAACHQAYRVKK